MKLLASLAVVGLSVAVWAQASHYDGVAAYVNNKVITVDTVMKELHLGFNFSQMHPMEARAKIRELFPVVRDMAIDRMLILKAYEDSGAQLPNEIVNERIQMIIAEDFDGDEAKLKEELRRNRMTYAEWVKQTRENMVVTAMRQLQVNKKIVVSPQKVKTYYAEHMDEFTEDGGVRVRTMLFTPDQGAAAAEAAMAELKAGKPFEEVAKAVSSDLKAAEGGDWGYVKPEEVFAPQMVEVINGLKVGEISDILENSGYRSIVQKVDVRKGRRATLQEAWKDAENAVRQELGQERYNQWVESLRKNAFIKVTEVQL